MYSLLRKSRVLFTIILVIDYGLNPKCMLDFKFFYKNHKYKYVFFVTVLTLGLWKFGLCVGSPDCTFPIGLCVCKIDIK